MHSHTSDFNSCSTYGNDNDSNESSILGHINSLFESDPNIDEYGILFGETSSDSSLTENFVLLDHKLGISVRVLQPMFLEAHKIFFSVRRRVCQSGADGKQLDSACSEGCLFSLIQSSRVLLMINPDQQTAWNLRKQLVENGYIEAQAELKFLDLIFTKHAKKPSSWAHRGWCVNLLVQRFLEGQVKDEDSNDAPSELSLLLQNELKVCTQVADRYPRNYYAWAHRCRLLPYLSSAQLAQELEFSKQWMKRHVSDFSCLNYRILVFSIVFFPAGKTDHELACIFIKNDLEWLSDLIENYPGHISLWYYRKALIKWWCETPASSSEENFCPSVSAGNTCLETTNEELLKSELDFIEQCLLDESVWDYEKQKQQALSHQSFLLKTVISES